MSLREWIGIIGFFNPYSTHAFEFKLDKTAEEALQQIEEKGYLEPYADSPKEKIAIGINFSSEEKKVTDWLVHEF